VILGTSPGALWPTLPWRPPSPCSPRAAISYIAGQAGFTVLVVIMFNPIQPVGWRVALVRVEEAELDRLWGVALHMDCVTRCQPRLLPVLVDFAPSPGSGQGHLDGERRRGAV
jgi:hypothetical protein